MNFDVLRSFIADQRQAKELVSKNFHLPVDIRALDWVFQSRSVRKRYAENPFAQIFRPHGYGLELKVGDLHIDYDYSSEGRPDGFDAWRLYVYMMGTKFDDRDEDLIDHIREWIDKLHSSGRLIRPDNLYYLVDNGCIGDIGAR